MQNTALPHAGDACRLVKAARAAPPDCPSLDFRTAPVPRLRMRATPAGGWKSRRREQGAGVIPRDWAKGAFVLKRAAPSCPSGDVHFGDRLRRRRQTSSYATCPFATIPQRRAPPLPGPCRHGHRDRLMAERPWRDGQGGAAAMALYRRRQPCRSPHPPGRLRSGRGSGCGQEYGCPPGRPPGGNGRRPGRWDPGAPVTARRRQRQDMRAALLVNRKIASRRIPGGAPGARRESPMTNSIANVANASMVRQSVND